MPDSAIDIIAADPPPLEPPPPRWQPGASITLRHVADYHTLRTAQRHDLTVTDGDEPVEWVGWDVDRQPRTYRLVPVPPIIAAITFSDDADDPMRFRALAVQEGYAWEECLMGFADGGAHHAYGPRPIDKRVLAWRAARGGRVGELRIVDIAFLDYPELPPNTV